MCKQFSWRYLSKFDQQNSQTHILLPPAFSPFPLGSSLLLPLLLLLLYRHHNLLLVLPSLCISLATGHRSDSVSLNATFDSASNLKRMRRPDTLVNSVIKQLRWSASGLAISFCDIDADAVTWRALRSYRRRQLLMASSALTWEHVLQIDFLIKLGIRISPNV